MMVGIALGQSLGTARVVAVVASKWCCGGGAGYSIPARCNLWINSLEESVTMEWE